MKLSANKFLLLPACILFSVTTVSQAPLTYQQFTSDQGLSENVVYCLLQDKNGFIWAGTHHGLNRFDGYSFKKFYCRINDSTTISNNSINDMIQDDSGMLWIATSRGLNLFDPETGKNTRIQMKGKGLDYGVAALRFLDAEHLVIDLGDQGVQLFRIRDRQFIKSINNSSMKGLDKFFSIPGKEKRVTGLSRMLYFDSTLHEWKYLLPRNSKAILPGTVFRLYADRAGNRFLFNYRKSFEIIDKSDHLIQKLDPKELVTFNPISIYDFEESDEDVWIGTSRGLLQFNQPSKSFAFRELVGDSKSLKGNKEIRCTMVDRDGNLWLGIFGEGLLKCNIRKSPFASIGLEEMTGRDYQRMIFGLYEWPKGELAAETGFRNFSIMRENRVIGHVNSEMLDLQTMIFVTTGKQLSEISNTQQQIAKDLFKKGQLLPNQFFLEDSSTIVLTSPMFRIYQKDKWYSYNHYTTHSYDDGEFYWAASTNGLLRVDKKSLKDTLFINDPKEPFSLQEPYLYCVIGDEQKNLWIGTKGGGLSYFDRNQNRFYHYTTQDGLPDDVIYYILPDKKGNLWLSTNNGLSRFNIKQKTFQNFSRRDGLLNSEFNRNGGVLTKDGTLYFSGTSGIDYFKSEDIVSDTIAPQIYFSGMHINGDERIIAPDGNYHHSLNNFTFFFTANDFTRPDLVYYRYRLKGIINEWVRVQGVNYVSFNVLPPGNYTMEVQSSYNNLNWSNSAIYEFNIQTPWWRAWWFYFLSVLFIAVLLYLFYRYRINQLNKVVAIRTKISRDLHDEVGATLSGISMYSHLTKEQIKASQTQQVTKSLDVIQNSASQMVNKLNDIVWVVNPRHDTLEKLVQRLEEYTLEMATVKGIKVKTAISPHLGHLKLPMEGRKHIYMLCKEAVNNAVKYSQGTEIIFEVTSSGNILQLIVADNGKGFSIEHIKPGLGLESMYQRSRELGGTLTIHSSPGMGTSVCLVCKIPH